MAPLAATSGAGECCSYKAEERRDLSCNAVARSIVKVTNPLPAEADGCAIDDAGLAVIVAELLS